MPRGARFAVLLLLATAPCACTALFPVSDLGGGDAGNEATTDANVEEGGGDASRDAPPSVDAGDAAGDATPTDDAQDATGDDAPSDAAPMEADAPPPPTYAQEVLMDSPKAYWRFDEAPGTTTAADASGHGVTGTYKAGVTLGAKGALANDPDTAVSFDGSTGFVDFGQVFQFAGTAQMSLEAWVDPVLDTNYHAIVSRDDGTPPAEGYLLFIEPLPPGGGPFIDFQRVDSGTKNTAQTSSMPTAGTWMHVVMTYDGTTMTMYFDGVAQGTTKSTISLAGATSDFVAGAEVGGTDSPFEGTLDEVAVYDYALPAARVLAHYHVGIGQSP